VDASPLPDEHKLLVVDDEPLMTELFRQYMTRRGFQVLVATTGAEAIRIAGQEAGISLVMTDMTMPGMSGVQLAEALLTELPGVPVMIATGHDASSGIEGMPTNVVAVVQKPFQNRDLIRNIRSILGLPAESS
jgi:CheY-like chemotaxis protein